MSLLDVNFQEAPYLALILFGFLPSEIWRFLAVAVARQIDEKSELFLLVRSVATVLLVGVVVKIIFVPSPELAAAPVLLRAMSFVVAAAAYFMAGRSVFAAIVAGVATIVGYLSFFG